MSSRKGTAGAVFCLVLLSLALPAFSKDKIAESRWATAPPAVDGSAVDWSEATYLTEENAGADLAFGNDADYLYALLIIKDKKHLSSFNFTGIAVYLNAEGKKNKDRKLHFFKKAATAQEVIQTLEKSGQTLTEEKKAELLSQKNYVLYRCELIEGKKVLPIETMSSSQPLPPIFMDKADGGRTSFEFRIPLSRENQASGIGAVPGGKVKVGFEWGGLTEEMKARRMANLLEASERNISGAIPAGSSPGEYLDRGVQTEMEDYIDTKKAPPPQFSFWLDLKLVKAE